MAGVQRPRAGRGRERRPPPAGAGAVPVHLGQQPGRVLHDPRGGPEGAVPRAHPRRLARRPDPRRAVGAGQRRSRRPDGRTTAPVARPAQGNGRRRDRDRRTRPHHQDRARAAGARVPEPAVRSADADGHRPGASLPLPAEPGLLAGAEAAAQQRQPRPVRPGAGADAGAALLGAGDGRAVDAGADALCLAGKPAAAVHRPHVSGLRDPGKGPVPPDPRFRHRDRGRSRRPGHGVRRGAETAPHGLGRPHQDSGGHARRPARLHHRPASRPAAGRGAGRRDAGAGPAVRTDPRRAPRPEVQRL